jgi:antitoxin component YwqK of YwqJK toxin-antitoxin module
MLSLLKHYPFLLLFFISSTTFSQYKKFELDSKHDTINIVDAKGLKQKWWIIKVPELRGEAGYTEVGQFKNDKKEGEWRIYNSTDDVMAIEQYHFGGKDGISRYFNMYGDLLREESWKGYNPETPYDTIPIYGQGNDEITTYKIVKAEPYSVKHGTWKYYEKGKVVLTEKFDRGLPLKNDVAQTSEEPKKKVKPKEVLEFEKKHSGKKATKVITGEVGY